MNWQVSITICNSYDVESDELVGKIWIRRPRESYAVINLIFMGLQFG